MLLLLLLLAGFDLFQEELTVLLLSTSARGELGLLLVLKVFELFQVLAVVFIFELHAPVKSALVTLHSVLDNVEGCVTSLLACGAKVNVDFWL